MTMQPNSQEARDVAYQLHAYTNARSHQQAGPLVIERGEGPYVFDAAGKRYLEAMAGLWSVGLGFSEKRLVDAAHRQMQALPFYHTFASRSHGPSIDLAEKLVKMAPVPMSKVFFTNSGSEANDTVLKLIAYRSNALGQPQRKKVISRLRGYHGVTIASASLTGLPNNHRSFDLPLPNILHTGSPHHYKDAAAGESEEAFATRRAEELDALIQKEGPDTIAAFFGEPVMGAGGVIVPPATYWEKIQAVLNKYDILLVADEVICGFGRTGKMFGCETFNIRPDVLVVSKQITSSYFPFSAIIMNDRMFEPIADESNKIGVLGHGFTAGGHPVGSAVALENLRIIEERNLVAHAAEIGAYMQDRLRTLADHPLVGEVRGIGLIAAVELVLDKTRKVAAGTPGALGGVASRLLLERGIISRNMLDALAICPPLIVTKVQIDELVDGLAGMLEDLKAEAAKLTPA
ncbi:aspartate aminotransferase family protein [Bradyrhizobium manausense]|uniref:aspartate aminotransferase family protein n=1 Tax=Bradyrhizobium TaxID=374 RepID=UPI001BAC7D2C|nr:MULTISPECIES: aspartate aminotransferase family protein [Bradyrhizobium]MBR0828000.1 aspartate aminotransferase family protein [Bradyrhizobium manausense]UVO32863.1 aspartate aminotransferase family protein [Bradyrhizobium arachidis]